MSDPIELGAGTVTTYGQTTRWDRIRLLHSGALRVARTIRWTDSETRCTAEESVEYYAPGSWSSVKPEVRENGTLVLHVDGYAPEVIGTCLTESQAIVAAAEYLIDNYDDATWHAERIDRYFGSAAPRAGLRSVHTEREDSLHFEWVVPPA